MSLPQSLPLSLSFSLSLSLSLLLPLSHQPAQSHQPVQPIMSHQPFQPVQPIIVIDTQPYYLTWIIYQGHLSTRCTTSLTHASTKKVPISPTYHHTICVSTKYQTINLYNTKNQLCTTTYITTSASTMHQHLYHVH
jgi:hypothetical protein